MTVSHFRDPPQALLCASGMIFWRQTEPGGKVPSRLEAVCIRHTRGNRCSRDGTDSRNTCQPPADRIALVKGDNFFLEGFDPAFQSVQFRDNLLQRDARHARQPLVARVSDYRHKLQKLASRRYQPELADVRAQHIGKFGALADQLPPHPVQYENRLVLNAFDRHKAHVRPAHRFADRLRVNRVALAALDVGLDIGWRNEPNDMVQFCEFASPVVRTRASLKTDDAPARQRREKLQHLGAPQTFAKYDTTRAIFRVYLKHVLRNIQTNRGNFHQIGRA